MKLVTGTEMRALEQRAFAAGATPEGLMANAGHAIADALHEPLGGIPARRIVVLVGPGNNGGDGLVAARHLSDFGAEVIVYLLAARSEDDPNLIEVRRRDIELVRLSDGVDTAYAEAIARADAIIDAVLGTGSMRPLDGTMAAALDGLKGRRGLLFAVDLPSGVNADTGEADPHSARADVTLTLGMAKTGLYTWPGSSLAGEVNVLDIGLDPTYAAEVKTELLTPEWAREHLPERPGESNKGSYGRALIVAGCDRYLGAATLASLGALRSGAGLGMVAAVASVRAAVASNLPEVTFLPLPEAEGALDAMAGDVIARALPGNDVMLMGPGLSTAPGVQSVVRGVLTSEAAESMPVVLDADALNCLAHFPGWHERVKARAVLTPHPGEAGRLANMSVADVQTSRLPTAQRLAQEWQQTVVLKGAHTVVAAPDGSTLVSPFANAALATAGTGDVLAGTIAGLIAQGVEPSIAAGLGVYLHGAAAEEYAADYGASGLLANELARGIAVVAAALRRG
jgi:NAD(P)H-hydrate epimerase